MKPKAVARNQGVRMMLYGLPGIGKTRLIASGPPCLIIRPPTDSTDSIVLPSQAEEMVVEDWNQMLEVYQYLQQGEAKGKYKWVWLDTITLFQELGLDDIFDAAIARHPHRAEFGYDKGEYGVNMTRLGRWVRDMVGLANEDAFNFGMVAHVMEWHDPVQDQELWSPLIAGKNMSPKMCGYCNIVAYYQETRRKGKPAQRLLLTDAEGFVGTDKLDAFPELKSGRHGFVDPSFDEVDAAIEAARKPSRPRTRKRPAARRKRTTK